MKTALITELPDMLKVGTVGTGGFFASLKLADYSLLVSIGVGLMTIAYIGAKLFYLVKSGGQAKGD